jgi:GT2 family glycosyltransferase
MADGLRVSVLVATRNRAGVLAACLSSVLGQNERAIEVVVLDDASSDPGATANACVAAGDERVRSVRSEAQLGVAGARNRLLEEARAPLAVFIDDDAVFADAGCLGRMADCLDAHPQVGIVAVRVVEHRPGGEVLLVPFSKRVRRADPSITNREQPVSYFVGTAHAFRREAIQRLGGYPGDLVYGEEESFLAYRAVAAGVGIRYLPSVTVHHHPAPSVVGHGGREMYYHVRNRWWLAWGFLPLPYLLTFWAVWSGFLALQAVRQRALGAYLRGMAAGVAGLARRRRTPLSREAVAYQCAHHGRLWY